MSDEFSVQDPNQNLVEPYALCWNALTGQIMVAADGSLEARDDASYTTYAIDLAYANGAWTADMPPGAAAGVYVYDVRDKLAAGDDPATTDDVVAEHYGWPLVWNGSALVFPLPNAAADAPGGLPISNAGGLDLDALAQKKNYSSISENITSVSKP